MSYFFGQSAFSETNQKTFKDQSLTEILKDNNGYKVKKWENYLLSYNRSFKEYQNKPIKLLEIGVRHHDSLEIWNKFFVKNQGIYGVEVSPTLKDVDFGKNVMMMDFDVTNQSAITENLNNLEFEIIIDSSLHTTGEDIKIFDMLFAQKLKPGGIYIFEDLHSFYQKDTSEVGKPGLQEFSKNLVDVINTAASPDKKDFTGIENEDLYKKWILSIEFHGDMIMVRKSDEPIQP